jgi:S1-C subfamily serine protease
VVDAARGLILTCEQVIENAPRVVIIFADGREIETDRIARDPRTELVLLSVDPKGVALQEAQWEDSATLQIGDWVLSMGRTLGHSTVVSAGIVSGAGGAGRESRHEGPIRTDAVISPLNTGGPLINLEGKVVGINHARGEPRGWSDGFGHAISSAVARRVASDLAEFGRVKRGYLGLVIEPEAPGALDPRIRTQGLVVTGITPGSPAAEAGFQLGDRIVALDGRPMTQLEALSQAVEDAPVGREFTLTVERGGKRQEIKVQTRQRPEPPGVSGRSPGSTPPGMGRRIRPREGARGGWVRPALPRQPGAARSDRSEDRSPGPPAPPAPGQPDQAPGQKDGQPGKVSRSPPDSGPTRSLALDLEPAGPTARSTN